MSSVLYLVWAKTDFTGTCCSKSPVHRLSWKIGGRAPPQLQRVLALSPPRVGRFPCAQLRTTRDAAPAPARRARSMHAAVAVEVFHLPPSAPCGEPDEGALRPTPLPADSCRTAGIEEMGLHRIRQSVGATNKRPCFKTAASFDCGLSRHRDSRFFRAPGPPGDQTDDRLEEACGCRPHSARQRRAPCTASLATCYETPDLDRDTRRGPRTRRFAVITRRSTHCSLLRTHKPGSPLLLCPARTLVPLAPVQTHS